MTSMATENPEPRNFKEEINEALRARQGEGINTMTVYDDLFTGDEEMKTYLALQHVNYRYQESLILAEPSDVEQYASEQVEEWGTQKQKFEAGIAEVDPLILQKLANAELVRRFFSDSL